MRVVEVEAVEAAVVVVVAVRESHKWIREGTRRLWRRVLPASGRSRRPPATPHRPRVRHYLKDTV